MTRLARTLVQGGTFPSPLDGQSPSSLPPPRAPRAELPGTGHPSRRPRLARLLGLAAALGFGAVVLGCPFFHDAYPPSSNECSQSSDCLYHETCSDAGLCEPQSDAGTGDASLTDGGSHAG